MNMVKNVTLLHFCAFLLLLLNKTCFIPFLTRQYSFLESFIPGCGFFVKISQKIIFGDFPAVSASAAIFDCVHIPFGAPQRHSKCRQHKS